MPILKLLGLKDVLFWLELLTQQHTDALAAKPVFCCCYQLQADCFSEGVKILDVIPSSTSQVLSRAVVVVALVKSQQ